MRFWVCSVLILLNFLNLAQAQVEIVQAMGDSALSHIAISKTTTNENFFIFSFCHSGQCEVIGSEHGYSRDQIRTLNGYWQLVSGAASGLAGAGLIYILGKAGWALGGRHFAFVGNLAGIAAGVSGPLAAMSWIDAINPIENLQNGYTRNRMRSSLRELLTRGEASVIFYQSRDLDQTISKVRLVNEILKTL